jgi:hypothetical protein
VKKPPPIHGKKSTNIEAQERVAEIEKMLILGHTRSKIIRHGAEKWNLAERQMEVYIARAREAINEINEISVKETLAVVTTNLWFCYREHVRKSQIHFATTTLMNIAKLLGLSVETVRHVIDQREFSKLADDQLDRRLIEIKSHVVG